MNNTDGQFQPVGTSAWETVPKMGRRSMGKFIVIGLCVLYILSPLDIIPDFLPVVGWGDDVIAALIGLRQFMK